jgi:hypothetical protein
MKYAKMSLAICFSIICLRSEFNKTININLAG